MSGNATVVIGTSTWECSLAQSITELTSGLSGVASIPTSTGVLFDMGLAYSEIQINTDDMLFSIDIVYMDEDGVVLAVSEDVAPGDVEAYNGVEGARYFMEINAGEATDVDVGDEAAITIAAAGSVLDILYTALPAMILVMMMGVAAKSMR